jgi:hypothetical protein
MSTDHEPADTSTWRCPPGRGEVTPDGERYRITWHPSSSTTATALFRVSTDDRVCVLLHVRRVHVRQRGETRCVVDDSAGLDDVPAPFLAAMERDGFQPAAGVSDFA